MEDNQLKVLVVDDNEDDIFLVKKMIIGNLAVMDDKPMLDKKRTLSILKILRHGLRRNWKEKGLKVP